MTDKQTNRLVVRSDIRAGGCKRWRQTAGSVLFLLAMLAGMEQPVQAEILLGYDFSSGMEPNIQDARIAHATPFDTAYSLLETNNGVATSRGWDVDEPANYFCVTLVIEPGYALDLESIALDYLSERGSLSFWLGPDSGEIRLGKSTAPFQSLTGWQQMFPDGVWHRDVTLGVGVQSLTGQITVALAARGAFDSIAELSLDNFRLLGNMRWLDADAVSPRLAASQSAGKMRVEDLEADRFYTLQSAASPGGNWRTALIAANLQSAQSSMEVPLPAKTANREFYRMVSSRIPLPAVDLDGFWRVSSTGVLFRTGIIHLHHFPSHVRFEDELVGTVQGTNFFFGHGDGNAVGTATENTLVATYLSRLNNGAVLTGAFTAERYVGHAYEIWEGDAALNHSQCYDPSTNGYVRLAQASSTVTVRVSRARVVVVGVASVPIDAFQGPGGVSLEGVDSSTGGVADHGEYYGPPDGVCSVLGTSYVTKPYRGYVTFMPPGWSELTVVVCP